MSTPTAPAADFPIVGSADTTTKGHPWQCPWTPLRVWTGVPQDEIAKRIGVAHSSISKLELHWSRYGTDEARMRSMYEGALREILIERGFSAAGIADAMLERIDLLAKLLPSVKP